MNIRWSTKTIQPAVLAVPCWLRTVLLKLNLQWRTPRSLRKCPKLACSSVRNEALIPRSCTGLGHSMAVDRNAWHPGEQAPECPGEHYSMYAARNPENYRLLTFIPPGCRTGNAVPSVSRRLLSGRCLPPHPRHGSSTGITLFQSAYLN